AKDIVSDFRDVKVVSTLHGTDVTLVGTQPTFRKIVSYALNKGDSITCVSEFLYHSTIREFSPSKPIEIIHNFVDTDEFKRVENAQLRNRFASESEKVLIHISNFRPVKKVEDVVYAFSEIKKKIPSKLILVGDGPEMPKIEMQIKKLGIFKDVYCLGEQSSIAELLSIADLFLLTSEIESFGLAALEALSCGVPVVCYDVGGLKELVLNDVNGYLVEFGNTNLLAEKALQILKDDSRLVKFRKNAREIVLEKFDKRVIIPKYLNLFKNLLS
ncbi:MAG: N-acetyl-alpha-D-glucosaminyl L-malate synthase BshA, partial [Candidatus Kapaibacteriota bacterium]